MFTTINKYCNPKENNNRVQQTKIKTDYLSIAKFLIDNKFGIKKYNNDIFQIVTHNDYLTLANLLIFRNDTTKKLIILHLD